MTIIALREHTAEWHAHRLSFIGGSEVCALFGVEPETFPSHYALWHIKQGLTPAPHLDDERVTWGSRLERAIARGAAREEGWALRKGGYAMADDTPGMGCSLDGIITKPGPKERAEGVTGPGVLQVKNVDFGVYKARWLNGMPPEHIVLQVQHEMACTGFSWCAVAALVGGNSLKVVRIKASLRTADRIKAAVNAFWQSIRDNRPPPVDRSDSTADVLRAMREVLDPDNDAPYDLSHVPGIDAICFGLNTASADRLEAEKIEQGWKNRLIAAMGNHTRAVVPAAGYAIDVAITAARPARRAQLGEIIPGRAESRRYTVKVFADADGNPVAPPITKRRKPLAVVAPALNDDAAAMENAA
jgi:putative phage-type endonuclease